jgi:pimeloyl-ACP methyl ester carboxylesterase
MNALRFWLAVVLLPGSLGAAAPGEMAAVLVHGKQGSPTRDMTKLAAALRERGYAVATPTMPWAEDRIYAAHYAAALAQLDQEVTGLRRRGARSVVMVGFSLGANGALGYAAVHPGLAGLVLLAPGHFPENPLYQQQVAAERARALRLLEAGQGAKPVAFQDSIQGVMINVRATPAIYLGYTDPAGPAVMARNAALIPAPLPILLIQENNPAVAAADAAIFRAAPADSRSRYRRSEVDHMAVPDAAIPEILAWLLTLSESVPPHSPPAHR